MNALIASCLRCHGEFVRRRAGHVFCSTECRHRGPRHPDDPPPPTDDELARLFDDRPAGERVAADEWFPIGDGWKDLYASETLGRRHRWFRNLVEGGEL